MCFTNAELRKAIELRQQGQTPFEAIRNATVAEGINHDIGVDDPDPALEAAELAYLRGATDALETAEPAAEAVTTG